MAGAIHREPNSEDGDNRENKGHGSKLFVLTPATWCRTSRTHRSIPPRAQRNAQGIFLSPDRTTVSYLGKFGDRQQHILNVLSIHYHDRTLAATNQP